MTTERNYDLKFEKGTIYIIYLNTHVHVHIEKMGLNYDVDIIHTDMYN